MATDIEYALMAGASYISTRADINQFPVPDGWLENVQKREKDDATGFEATYFTNGSEIVISFAGVYNNPPSTFSNPDRQAAAGLVLGGGSEQLLQAAEYYLQVKATGANIKLTGHSLGGGLAALIGVFFGVEAHTFDQAPFSQTALFKANDLKAYLVSKLDGNGNRIYSDEMLAPLTSYIDQKEAFGSPPTLIPNANLVTNINVQGEFLSGIPWNIFNRIGTTSEDIANSAAGVSGDDLHAQALLTAYLQSNQTADTGKALSDVTYKLPDLLKMIFDKALFARSTATSNTTDENLLERLVKHEAGVRDATGATTLAADQMLTRFTRDLWQLAQDGGLTMADGDPGNPELRRVSDALIAFAMQMYYEDTALATNAQKELFTAITNGLRFDLADISTKIRTALDAGKEADLADAKGYEEWRRVA
jgi:hypothetical protein